MQRRHADTCSDPHCAQHSAYAWLEANEGRATAELGRQARLDPDRKVLDRKEQEKLLLAVDVYSDLSSLDYFSPAFSGVLVHMKKGSAEQLVFEYPWLPVFLVWLEQMESALEEGITQKRSLLQSRYRPCTMRGEATSWMTCRSK